MPSEGLKYDDGKDPWHLLPWRATREVVRVLAFGATKYGPHNWQLVDHHEERYHSAAIRHMMAWYALGERNDPETGLHHLAHAACCILFLLAKEVGLDHKETNETRPDLPYP